MVSWTAKAVLCGFWFSHWLDIFLQNIFTCHGVSSLPCWHWFSFTPVTIAVSGSFRLPPPIPYGLLFCIYVDKGRFYIVGNYSQNLVIDIAGGIAGTFLVLVLSQIIERIPLVSSGFQWFGRHSLVILCLHLVELTFLPWKTLLERIGITNIIVIGGLAVTGKLVWCITGVLIIEKIPILSVAFGLSKNTTNKEGTAL